MLAHLNNRLKPTLGPALGLFILCFALSPLGASPAQALQTGEAPPSFAELSESVKESVVNISTSKVIERQSRMPFTDPDSPLRDFFGEEFFERFFGRQMPRGKMRTRSLGSGVVISKDGTVLTNNHVIEKADEIKIKLDNGKEYDAQVIGRDPKTDLALIQAQTDENFPKPAKLGDSEAIRVGDWIIAVGNPFGLGHTVTAGIISAKGRIIGAGPYDDFLQTDAAINPGNSGGPLFNMAGEVVGINTAIISQGQGIGFAIPINLAKDLLPQLRKGKVIRGWLGVMIQDVTSEIARSFDLEEEKGALVADVLDDSPAEKAGLQRGDIIVGVDGETIEDAHALSRRIASIEPGTEVSLQVIRDGDEKAVKVDLGTMPSEQEMAEEPAAKESSWGFTVQSLTPEMSRQFGWDENEKGVIITSIKPGTPAQESRLRPGDLIKEINRRTIEDMDDYKEALEEAEEGKPLLLLVKREDRTFFEVVEPFEEKD